MRTSNKNLIFRSLYIFCIAVASIVLTASTGKKKVTIKEDAETYILDNGIVTARVAKASGDLVSLRYKEMEMLATFLTPAGEPDLQRDPPGANPNGLNKGMTDHQYGFWSHDAMGPKGTTPPVVTITIDPKNNKGKELKFLLKESQMAAKWAQVRVHARMVSLFPTLKYVTHWDRANQVYIHIASLSTNPNILSQCWGRPGFAPSLQISLTG